LLTPPVAVSAPGAEGGVASPTIALASLDGGPMLPAASSAATL
jgi:hypothetical protein